jgi:hypothetical protein
MVMETEGTTTTQRRTFPILLVAVMLLLPAGTWVAWLGTREQAYSAAQPAAEPPRLAGPVVHIELPYEEMELPPGPHRERFQVACTVCHSPRLAFTQALLTEKKWAEVVHKMVAVYGAPISPQEERDITSYLTAVHGP